MAFIRVKTIKGNEYAYLVENHWNGKSSRQRVTEYLGKVVSFPSDKTAPAPNMNGSFPDTADELVAWQLIRLGFKRKDNLLQKGEITFDLKTHRFMKKERPIRLVIKNRDGYLCEYTTKELSGFVPAGQDHEIGLELAKTVVNCGLDLPKELFVALFEKAVQSRRSSQKLREELNAARASSKPF